MAIPAKRLLTFEEVRDVTCEFCKARKGEQCRPPGWEIGGKVRHMKRVHPERYRAAARRRDESDQAHSS